MGMSLTAKKKTKCTLVTKDTTAPKNCTFLVLNELTKQNDIGASRLEM